MFPYFWLCWLWHFRTGSLPSGRFIRHFHQIPHNSYCYQWTHTSILYPSKRMTRNHYNNTARILLLKVLKKYRIKSHRFRFFWLFQWLLALVVSSYWLTWRQNTWMLMPITRIRLRHLATSVCTFTETLPIIVWQWIFYQCLCADTRVIVLHIFNFVFHSRKFWYQTQIGWNDGHHLVFCNIRFCQYIFFVHVFLHGIAISETRYCYIPRFGQQSILSTNHC